MCRRQILRVRFGVGIRLDNSILIEIHLKLTSIILENYNAFIRGRIKFDQSLQSIY